MQVWPQVSPANLFVIFLFKACREAYSRNDEQFACNLGCQSQLPFAERRQEQVCHTHSFASGNLGMEQLSVVCFFSYFTVRGHDAKDTRAVSPYLGQRTLGGCNEPGPQLHHFLVDFVPPSRWWQSCCFPGVVWQYSVIQWDSMFANKGVADPWGDWCHC